MNLICITESELVQWVSRRHFDTLSARVLTNQEGVNRDIFSTSPYLKLEDARGRIVVNLKDDWKHISSRVNTTLNIEVISIPLDAIEEIAPAMDQYAKRLEIYQLPIATWSVEKVWDEWLINQAVSETYRATVLEINRIGCIDKETVSNETLLKTLIEKSLRPNIISGDESVLMGWEKVLERRDDWIQALRVKGHLDNTSMLKASVEIINNDLFNHASIFDPQIADEERGWEFQDITPETLQQFSKHALENIQPETYATPPLFCMVAYLRLYDEIHNGDKNWRVVFNLLRFTKFSVNSLHADLLTISLLASLKAEEIYSLGLRDLYIYHDTNCRA
jgi:hypothetical protein